MRRVITYSQAALLLAVLLSAGCGTMNAVRALPKGESALAFSCGGPVTRIMLVDAPLPYAVLSYRYGLTDWLGISASNHATLLALGRIGLQGDLTCRFFRQQGWRPECGAGVGLLFLSGLNSDSRVYPEVAAAVSWLVKDQFLTYLGVQSLFQLARDRDPTTPLCVWAPVLGEEIRLNRQFSVTLETKWYAPFEKTTPRAVEYLLPIAGHGAVGFVLGVRYAFGRHRS